jgi:hypothetical protein
MDIFDKLPDASLGDPLWREKWTAATDGSWSQVWPSNSRPPALGVRPPHCLKKKATPSRTHRSRSPRTQCGHIVRYPIPLSPGRGQELHMMLHMTT